jgi:aspartyl-tRNA(Asn)/glutamyl-tRNA(Gln) amidotransferase subunit A
MNKEDICFMPACEMVEKIKTQELTSVEITEILIERIEKINPLINAYCTPTFDLAREMAKKADDAVKKGETLGKLNGIPTSIKDLNLTKGIRTTFGSKLYENFIPEDDGEVVKRLKNAGCVILGKTNTPEFGYIGVTHNFIFGETKNPWNLKRTSGGSSGGAAAAEAAGLSILAQGSDGGGSIRSPSALNGLYGIKASFGRVPNYPQKYLFGETLKHIGPIVRNIKDAALMLDVMKGPHEGDKYSLPKEDINYLDHVDEKPKKLKIGYSLDLGVVKAIDPEVEKAVINSAKKFETLDWDVEEIKVKRKNIELAFLTTWTSMIAYDLKPKLEEWRDKMDPGLVKAIEAGAGYSGQSFTKAMNIRRLYYDIIYHIFEKYDIIITPTVACTAFELGKNNPERIGGKPVSPASWTLFTFVFNMTGHPAASIPCGWSSERLPIGMQIVGKRFADLTVLQVSKVFEEIAPWQDKRPKFN